MSTYRILRSTPLYAAALCASAIIALPCERARADDTAENLEQIVVKGQLFHSNPTFTSTQLTTLDIKRQGVTDVDELFRSVPGMAVRDLQLGTVANGIVIRGFGNGGHGGDLGVILDGIPLNESMSHADGYVDLNVVIPLEIESFSVLKGPVSALYGNYNRGGLVNILTRKSGDYAEADLYAASFDTAGLQLAYGQAIGERHQINLAGETYQTDGYRPQSGSNRNTVSGRWAADLTDKLQTAVSARYFTSNSRSASYLTLPQFQSDPRGIDRNVSLDGGEKGFFTIRGDVNYAFTDTLKLLLFGYTTQQDFTRWFTRPISATTWRQREETYDRQVYGGGGSLNGTLEAASVPISYVAGVETFREATDFRFFDGLNNRTRLSPALNDRETSLNSVSAFAEIEADVHPLAQFHVGLRGDRFTGGCRLLGPETGTDPCGDLASKQHVSPKLGVRSNIADWLQLRASWAEGFALANGFVKYAVGGQPLDENVFRQTEIGLRATAADIFEFDLAVYRLTSTGEVRTVSPGVYENFGATLRRGVEASVKWKPIEQIDITAVYGITEAKVKRNADTRLVGLTVPAVPKNSASVEINARPFPQWSMNAVWRYTGSYDVDALNTTKARSYGLFDVGMAYTMEGDHAYRVYLRLDNATNKTYASSVSLIGGIPVVAPGMPRALRGGVQLNF